MQKTINDQLALRILRLIQTGCNKRSELRKALNDEPEFEITLNDLTEKPNEILEIDAISGSYLIKGTASGAWPLNVHKFLDDNGYMSIIQIESGT